MDSSLREGLVRLTSVRGDGYVVELVPATEEEWNFPMGWSVAC